MLGLPPSLTAQQPIPEDPPGGLLHLGKGGGAIEPCKMRGEPLRQRCPCNSRATRKRGIMSRDVQRGGCKEPRVVEPPHRWEKRECGMGSATRTVPLYVRRVKLGPVWARHWTGALKDGLVAGLRDTESLAPKLLERRPGPEQPRLLSRERGPNIWIEEGLVHVGALAEKDASNVLCASVCQAPD